MEKPELIAGYVSRGNELAFLAAKPLYEQALAGNEDAQLLLEYGYLLECHARNELRLAVEQYRRAVELDPAFDKARYQLIQTLAALHDTDEMISLYRSPADVRQHRFRAAALLAAGRAREARAPTDARLVP